MDIKRKVDRKRTVKLGLAIKDLKEEFPEYEDHLEVMLDYLRCQIRLAERTERLDLKSGPMPQ